MHGHHLSQKAEIPILGKLSQDNRAVTRRPQDPFAVLKRSVGNQVTRDLFNAGAFQAKLTVNQPGDVHEQEADYVAEQVKRMSDTAEPLVQRTATSQARDATAPPVVHDVLSSSGQPLDPAARAFMEPRFGYDFGDVRIHTDGRAAESARAVNALAYTVGRNVVFGAGQYSPGTSIGQRLIAHELTHVVQQTGGETLGLQRAGTEEDKAKVPDAAIDALELAAAAKTAAEELKKKHPGITFTSGRRTIAEQASAMAANIVSSNDRKWIEKTYASAAALQEWVDDNPTATSQKDIAAGLEKTMNGMSDADRGKISKHLSGEAFDVQPQEKDAEAIKRDMRALPGLSKFLDKEGGLVRWHAQFKRADWAPNGYDPLEREADRVADQVMRMPDSAARQHQRTAAGQSGAVTAPSMMRQTSDEQQSTDNQQSEGAGFWGTIGGGLMGEFNEDPSFAMMGVDLGVSLIPILDQASDIRDLYAHLYFMIFRNQYDHFMRWVGLVFTLIGLFPELGSAIKGASKFVINGVREVLGHLWELLRPFRKVLPDLTDFGRLHHYVAANWNRWMSIGLAAWEQVIGRVTQVANAVPAFLNRHLRVIRERLDRVRKLAPTKLREAFAWARRKWDEIVQFFKRPGDEELEQAFLRLERGETPQESALLSDLLHHSQQGEALAELRRRSGAAMPGRPGRTPKGASINPQPGFQSAHTTPQSAFRDLAQYDPGDMITRILPTGRGHPHTVFDQFWQEEFRQIRKGTGRTTTTAGELCQVLERAARQSGAFSPAEAESVVGLIHEDLFVRLGLPENQVLRIPGT